MAYAGAGLRILAQYIDSFIIGIIILPIVLTTEYLGYSSAVFSILFFGVLVLYFSIPTSSSLQATLGQYFLKIRIGTLKGSKLSIKESISRSVIFIIPMVILFIGLQYSNKTLTLAEEIELTSAADSSFYYMISFLIGMIGYVFYTIWYLPIAFTKEKTGIHDLICKQRAFKRVKETS